MFWPGVVTAGKGGVVLGGVKALSPLSLFSPARWAAKGLVPAVCDSVAHAVAQATVGEMETAPAGDDDDANLDFSKKVRTALDLRACDRAG